MGKPTKLAYPLRYQHILEVEGQGAFPIDMLRYDGAHPASEQDSAAAFVVGKETRRVRVVHYSETPNWKPEYGRWQSFGWRVVE